MNNHRIINQSSPTNNDNAANKNYVYTLHNNPNTFIGDLSGSAAVLVNYECWLKT